MGETGDMREVHFADFQMWDYSPSHRRLLFRSPATRERRQNIDLLFTGVRELSTPTLLKDLPVHPLVSVTAGAEIDALRRFWLGSPASGFYVVAETHTFSTNFDDLYAGIPDAKESFRTVSKRYELAVAGALAKRFAVSATADPDRGPDLFVSSGTGRQLFVEAKRRDVGVGAGIVRELAMSLDRIKAYVDFDRASLLIVLGGQSKAVADELAGVLRTAFGTSYVSVVAWEPGGSTDDLELAAVELINP